MATLTRRQFVRKSGNSAAILLGTHSFSSFAKANPSEVVQMAVIGIRSRGSAHTSTLAKLPNVNVAAICDIDERLLPKAVADVEKITGKRPKTETDIRRILDNKEIDAISIATPNHWHALATIWACQAGKHVYVEKPVSYNISEGRKMVEAARKYDRIVQTGTQSRTRPFIQSAMDFLHSGKLGKLYMVKCVVFRPRESLGRKSNSAVPNGVHYDL